jgi:hypothetical protein
MNPADREQVRNETIDELCDWLIGCIEQVDHASDVYKACLAMANGMRKKKTDPTGVAQQAAEGQHYPLSQRNGVNFRRA